jgi:hypothetical protein
MTKSLLPKLLVSVRSVAEAAAALAGGASVIDIKEPRQGSLGMANVKTISGITEHVRGAKSDYSDLPVSAALGETTDWLDDVAVPSLACQLDYVKLGTAGLAPLDDWPKIWQSVRLRFEVASSSPLRWIAVSYVDWLTCDGPPPADIIAAAAASEADGVLFDTFDKQSGRLFDHVTQAELQALCHACRDHHLLAAVAGRLTSESLPQIVRTTADIVAVRSAVCDASDRCSAVQEESVSRFLEMLEAQGHQAEVHHP